MRFRPPAWVRLLGGAALLAFLAYQIDLGAVAGHLAEMSGAWVAVALGITLLQTALSAWRWRFTAGRLGLDLPLGNALGEYYRGLFLNQILPGGVLGDAHRAWRHASRERDAWGTTVRAVLLERVSGQVVMTGFAAASFLLIARRSGSGWAWPMAIGGIAVLGGLGAIVLAGRPGRAGTPASAAGAFLRDARTALFARDAVGVQVATSAVIVGSYVLTYLSAARAVGVSTAFAELAPLVPPVLLSMLIPLSVGGWGLREGAAASLWALVGLGAAEGVAISVAYGLIVLVGTLPGAYLLVFGGLGVVPAVGSPGDVAASNSRSKSTSAPSTK